MNATNHSLRSTPFELSVRKQTRFNFNDSSAIHTENNLYISHFFNALSLVTPITEGILIRSIRKAQPLVEGTQLESDAKAFIGQEAIHTREHRAFNTRLAELGFDMSRTMQEIEQDVKEMEDGLSLQEALALVVTGEHAIYAIARTILNIKHEKYTQEDEVRKLFAWHALEEMEHQSVCDDIYRHLHGTGFKQKFVYYRMFFKASRLLTRMILKIMRELLQQSRDAKPNELKSFMRWLLIDPALGLKTIKEVLSFFSPRFKHWQREQEDQNLINQNLSFVYQNINKK